MQTGRWFFFFNDTATTEIYTLSLHDALPISALMLRLYEAYGTLDIDEVIERMRARRAREEGEP